MASRVYGYQGYKGYQYETSPKKIQPDYEPEKIKSKSNKKNTNKSVKKKQETKPDENVKKMSKEELNRRLKLVCYVAFGFAVLFTISYRNSIINEKFNEKESLKVELAEIQKVNEQLEVSIENELNLTNVEAIAKDKLGMAKLSNSQKVYVSLPKKEYVEATSVETNKKDNQNIIEILVSKLKDIFKLS